MNQATHIQPITVTGYYYALALDARQHRVGINGSCTCHLGRNCSAVEIVRAYLQHGGQRAQRPPFGYYPVIPARCPVCRAEVYADASLSSPNRGMGWKCKSGGAAHYWTHRGRITMKRRELAERGKVV
jgi:hypothetical protein